MDRRSLFKTVIGALGLAAVAKLPDAPTPRPTRPTDVSRDDLIVGYALETMKKDQAGRVWICGSGQAPDFKGRPVIWED